MGKSSRCLTGLTFSKDKPPMDHQVDCLHHYHDWPAYAILADMGTGKTWIAMINAAILWLRGECDAMLVLAPNGVQTNWTHIELPTHMPPEVRWASAAWSSQNKKEERQGVEKILNPSATGALRILTMNWEALITEKGQHAALAFAKSAKSLMIVCDESDNIGNPGAQRTKFLLRWLGPKSRWRRIMTGTPFDGSPFPAFSQYNFLDHTILKAGSYSSFKAEYSVMYPPNHPMITALVAKNKLRFTPQIIQRDAENKPRYRNLEKLTRLISPYTFRVDKSVLNLPPKVYKSAMFTMTPRQELIYTKAENELRLEFDGNDTPFARIAIATKLTQITSGYYLHPHSPEEPVRIPGENRKLDLLVQRCKAIVEQGKQFIVWARYTIEVEDICAALAAEGITHAKYYGATKKSDRIAFIDAFEKGGLSGFVGNQQAGGVGITLVAASFVLYFSNNFRLRDRLQSEDRAHRKGQTKTVVYYNFGALRTIDEHVIETIIAKKDVSDSILKGTIQLFRR